MCAKTNISTRLLQSVGLRGHKGIGRPQPGQHILHQRNHRRRSFDEAVTQIFYSESKDRTTAYLQSFFILYSDAPPFCGDGLGTQFGRTRFFSVAILDEPMTNTDNTPGAGSDASNHQMQVSCLPRTQTIHLQLARTDPTTRCTCLVYHDGVM